MSTALSVVIPVHNRFEDLRRCLQALLQQVQLCSHRVEVLVVDNASIDFPEALFSEFPAVTFLKEPVPGVARARNCGGFAAEGTWLAFLDADTFPEEGWLHSGLEAVLEGKDTLMLAGRIDPLLSEGTVWEKVDQESLNQEQFVRNMNRAATGNFWISREFFVRLNGFDDSLYLYEDFDLTRRAEAAGGSLHYCDDCIVGHRTRADFSSLWCRTLRQARAMIVAFNQTGVHSPLKMAYGTVRSRLSKIPACISGAEDRYPSTLAVRVLRALMILTEMTATVWYALFCRRSDEAEMKVMQKSQR